MKRAINEIILSDNSSSRVFLKGNILVAAAQTRVKMLWLPVKDDDALIDAIEELQAWVDHTPSDLLGVSLLSRSKRRT